VLWADWVKQVCPVSETGLTGLAPDNTHLFVFCLLFVITHAICITHLFISSHTLVAPHFAEI
jgi:hypothetical protein